ncbi:MAG: TonB-dependent receptor [Caulobacterales bacterium]|nr:TonB-dependent receptor [Caulobacterales bacterium]
MNTHRSKRFANGGSLTLLAWLCAGPAFAEAPTPAGQLEEVVVTAQKRSENLQEVPTSISVLGGDQLEQLGATNLTQYAGYVPGLSVDTLGNPGEARITLRGIAPIGSGSAVGSYLDDVPVGSSTQHSGGSQLALDLMPYDIQRVEVLRGPQGTLYGASTMGGLLKYVTIAPDLTKFEGRIGGETLAVKSAGDAGWGLRGSLNLPIVSGQLALRASVYDQHTPGYIDNPVLGLKDVNAVDQKGGRITLLWRPSDEVSVKLGAVIQDIKTKDTTAVWRGPALEETFGDLASRYSRRQPFHQRLEIYSATVDWDLGWGNFTSASSYQKSLHEVRFDETFAWGQYLPLLDPAVGPGASQLYEPIASKKYTQELRLASPSGGKFEWLAGVFYTRERAFIEQNGTAETLAGAPIPSLNPFLVVQQHDAYDEYAAFGDLTYRFTDRFDVTAGLRWSHNSQKFDELVDGAFGFLILPAPPPQISRGKSSESVTTYMVSPRYHLTPDTMVYARVASGYRPGGPNVGVKGVPPQVAADTLVNYEVGLKSELLDHRAVVDLSVFYIEWSGIQINVTDPATSISYSANASSAQSKGVEFTTSYAPVRGLVLGLNAAYTDATLTSNLPANSPPLGWRKGDRLPYAPKWNGALTADYDFPIAAAWSGHVGGGFRYVGDRFSDPESSPLVVHAKSYTALDLNAGVSNDRWSLRLYARNLTDTRAYLSPSLLTDPLTGARDHAETTILQPRTIGVSLDARF